MRADEPIKPISEMRLLGGLPALDFVNTVDSRIGRWGPDLLISFETLVEFVERVELIQPNEASKLRDLVREDPAGAALVYARAKALREAIYRILLQAITSDQIGEDSLRPLNDELARVAMRREIRCEGAKFTWAWKPVELGDVATRLASASADLLLDETRLKRVKQCPGRNCGWLFLDETRNGRRRWCAEETCGVHSRVLRYRQTRSGQKVPPN